MYGMLTPDRLPSLDWFGEFKYRFHDEGTLNHTNEKKYKFFTRLKASVQKEGFRNPVCWYDPWNMSGNGGKPFNYGGSRTLMAVGLGMDLPVIVCDYTGDPYYDDFRELHCIDDVLECFLDEPSYIEFTDEWFAFWGCAQTHLEEESAGRRFFESMQPKQDNNHDESKRRFGDNRAAYYCRALGVRFEDGTLQELPEGPSWSGAAGRKTPIHGDVR